MVKILFVCHGNICRSPMAEFLMKDMVKKERIEERFYIASAATSTEELGNGVYPPVRRLLSAQGIDCSGKTARQLTRGDYERFDLLIGMDRANMRNMRRILNPKDADGKLHMLLTFAGRDDEVADPWYTRDFDAAQRDISEGCRALLDYARENFL